MRRAIQDGHERELGETPGGVGAKESSAAPPGETLRLLSSNGYRFGLKLGGTPEGWTTAEVLASDRKLLAEQTARLGERRDLSKRDAGLYVLGSYAWGVGGSAIGCHVLSRRVPDISPENVAVRFDGGSCEAALVRERFAVLPADPAAGHPGAVVVADEAVLLGWMRERLVAGVEPLLEGLRTFVRIGERAARSRVADLASRAFLMVAADTDDPMRHAADAETFVTAPGSPLRGTTMFFVVERGGERATFLTRGACCRAYRRPGHGHCDSCPMLTQEEREERAIAQMAARAGGRV